MRLRLGFIALLISVTLVFIPTTAQAADSIVVNATGSPTRYCTLILFCTDTYPNMSLYINGVFIGKQTVTSSANYTFSATLPTSGNVSIDLMFDNDAYYGNSLYNLLGGNTGDRNLDINSVTIGSKTILPTEVGVTVDVGTGYSAATDGVNTYTYPGSLYENSALRMSTTIALCCSGNLIAYYPMEETIWNGTVNELKDTAGYTGGPFNGEAIGTPKPTPTIPSPAKPGAAGTCGYSIFSGSADGGSAFNIDGLPVNTTAGVKTSVSFWMYWNGTDLVQPIGFQEYNLFFSGGKFGFNTGAYDIWGTNSNTLTNGWHHVVAVFANGNVSNSKLYIDGALKTLSQTNSFEVNNSRAYVNSTLRVSGWTFDTQWRFTGGRIDELKIYNGEVTQTQVTADLNATHLCPGVNVAPANFNCTVVGGSSSAGHLYTQLAGATFNIDIEALKSTGAVETSYVTSGTKNVSLEFVDGSGATACTSRASLSPVISQTVTFSSTDAGRKTVSNLNIPKAYRDLRCRVTDTNQSPNVIGCSTDNFSVRPANFTVSSSNATADLTSGASTTASPTIKAGASFSLTATTGVVGYDGTPTIDATKLNAHTGAVQVGNLGGAFSAASAATGNATATNINYSEVGYFNLAANGVYDSTFTAVDSANGDCATGFLDAGGQYACSFGNSTATNYFGRFIPDHFTLTTGATAPACNVSAVPSERFTYLGQDGFTTSFSLIAQNSANQTTQNYIGSFAKFVLTNWASYTFKANGLPAGTTLIASATAPTGAWSNGLASVVASHIVTRPASPVAGGNISISTTPTDSDGVTMPLTYVSPSSLFRFGRLWIPNTYGSELLPLAASIEAQYWNGNAYQRNQLDVCTSITPVNISMSHYKGSLAACETQLSGASTMVKGLTTAKLKAPGSGNNGSLDLTINLGAVSPAPNNKTCTSSTETSAIATGFSWFGSNPASRATFGIYKTPVIYMRENFNVP